jgi:FtsP/CotA-like multicopper oxidase with cupredoxin domain
MRACDEDDELSENTTFHEAASIATHADRTAMSDNEISSSAANLSPDDQRLPKLTRRRLLILGGAGALAATGVGAGLILSADSNTSLIQPSSALVATTEAGRFRSGTVVTRQLTAQLSTVDLGGTVVNTWTYNGQLPGPQIRLARGDRLRLQLQNKLPDATGTHWHGLAIRNDMDGVPGTTMARIQSGDRFDYDFVVPDAGTYWYHSHVGTQLDRGLYGPLIIDDPDDRGGYDAEAVLVLDDWLDGTGRTPDQVLSDLRKNGMAGMSMGGMGSSTGAIASILGGDSGDVDYPLFLINGKAPADPISIKAKPGQRLRLRLINAGGDTAFRFAAGGHRLTVTHADGYPVQPIDVDTLLLGMGERYDVTVTARDGIFPLVAYAEGNGGSGIALLRTGSGAVPAGHVLPSELSGRMLSYADLRPMPGVALPPRRITTRLPVQLTFNASGYQWLINGRRFDENKPLRVRAGERVQLDFTNNTSMFHPMHVHGHTFALLPPAGPGTRKDTVIVRPKQTICVALEANNPGQWMVHCHNAYHQEAGMMTVLSYVT